MKSFLHSVLFLCIFICFTGVSIKAIDSENIVLYDIKKSEDISERSNVTHTTRYNRRYRKVYRKRRSKNKLPQNKYYKLDVKYKISNKKRNSMFNDDNPKMFLYKNNELISEGDKKSFNLPYGEYKIIIKDERFKNTQKTFKLNKNMTINLSLKRMYPKLILKFKNGKRLARGIRIKVWKSDLSSLLNNKYKFINNGDNTKELILSTNKKGIIELNLLSDIYKIQIISNKYKLGYDNSDFYDINVENTDKKEIVDVVKR